jgi:hypothetical protein
MYKELITPTIGIKTLFLKRTTTSWNKKKLHEKQNISIRGTS